MFLFIMGRLELNMKKIALLIMAITIFSKILGFGRDITLSFFYGASNISDAYLISLTIPSVLFGIIAVGLTTAYIPMNSRIERELGIEEGNRYTSNLINIIMLVTLVIFILGVIFVEPIVKVFAMGFERSTLELAVTFTRISLIGIFFIGLISIFSGFLQIKEKYIIPALIGFPLNALVITSIYLSVNGNILILSIGTVIATASQVVFMIPYIRKKGFKYAPIINFQDKHIKAMFYIALPVIIGTSVNHINVVVDRTIASTLVTGGISALNYANNLNLFIQGIVVTSIIAVMYPMISKMVAEDNIQGLKKAVSESISSITLLILPATIGAMIFAEPIIGFLFGRGAFDHNAILMTSYALFFYSIGMLGFGLREILSRAFYSMQDTKTPMINAAIGMVLNIILNIVLSRYLGIGGLALATSIAAIFTSILLIISLRKKIGPFGLKQIFISFLKILFASSVMGIIAKLFYSYINTNISQSLSLLMTIAVGAVSYFIIIYFMKIEGVDVMVDTVKRKLGKTSASD